MVSKKKGAADQNAVEYSPVLPDASEHSPILVSKDQHWQ